MRWSHDKLRAQFFAKEPDEPVRVWLFKDERSYVTHVRGRAHRRPRELAALKAVPGREDLAAFQEEWEAWVMALEG